MPIIIMGIIEDVKTYTGKNGFGANVTMSQLVDKRRKSITFNTNSAEMARLLEEHLQEEMTLKIMLDQNNFGLRFGDILEVA